MEQINTLYKEAVKAIREAVLRLVLCWGQRKMNY